MRTSDAYAKVMSNIIMLRINIGDLERDIRLKRYGAVSKEENELVLSGYKKDLDLWEFILKKI
jgi:hypothetical protein